MTTQNRQGLLPGVTSDTRKSVSATPKRLHNALVPRNGITVGRDWKVGGDEMNVILFRRRSGKGGKETWATFGYYSTLGNALVGLLRQSVRDSELASLQAVQAKIEQVERDILRFCAGK
jgi:hypothetical protein